MKIYQMIAHSSNYTKNRPSKIQYIVVHYTANNGDTARGNGKYFQSANRNASAHYFVDDNEVIQSVLDTDVAWHCGANKYVHKYCRNNNSIGVEMCSRKDSKGNYYITDDTFRLTVSFVKSLMKQYNIPISNVIRHYDVTGKLCPRPFVDNPTLWDNFKKEVSKMSDNNIQIVSRGYKYNDSQMNTNVLNYNGENYIRVRDLTSLMGKDVKYDNNTKVTTIIDK